MMELTYAYSRARSTVNQVVEFESFDPETIIDIPPNLVLRNYFTLPPVNETEISNTVQYSEHSTSTERIALHSTGMNHVEGGWPRDVDPGEPEQMARYKRKCEKEDRYFPAAKQLFTLLRPMLKQNNAIDIYEDPLSLLEPKIAATEGKKIGGKAGAEGPKSGATGNTNTSPSTTKGTISSSTTTTGGGNAGSSTHFDPEGGEEGGSALEAAPPLVLRTSFSDPLVSAERPEQISRVATSINWHTADSLRHKVCVTFSPDTGYSMNGSLLSAGGEPVSSYVYDIHTPHQPETTITGPSALSVLKWSPRDIHLLGGGCTDGTVCIFDTRRAPRPIAKTAPSKSASSTLSGGSIGPQGKVSALVWLQVASKATEVLSLHSGGNGCFVWDIRNFAEPIDTIRLVTKTTSSATTSSGPSHYGAPPSLTAPQTPVGGPSINSAFYHTGLCADYSASTVGPGKILIGSSSGCVFNVNRRGRSETDRIQSTFSSHHGAVNAVHRNPFIAKNFATAGDWCVRLWNEDLKHPILTLPWCRSSVVDVCWHPTRPGVLASATIGGEVQLWNLLQSVSHPRATYELEGSHHIHCISFNFEGTLLSVGSTGGSVAVLGLSDDLLATPSAQQDKMSLVHLFDRILAREKSNAAEYKETLNGRHAELYIKEKRGGGASAAANANSSFAGASASVLPSAAQSTMFGMSTMGHSNADLLGGSTLSGMNVSQMSPRRGGEGGSSIFSPLNGSSAGDSELTGLSPTGIAGGGAGFRMQRGNAGNAEVVTYSHFPGLSIAPRDIDLFGDGTLDEQLGEISQAFVERLNMANTSSAGNDDQRRKIGRDTEDGEDASTQGEGDDGIPTAPRLVVGSLTDVNDDEEGGVGEGQGGANLFSDSPSHSNSSSGDEARRRGGGAGPEEEDDSGIQTPPSSLLTGGRGHEATRPSVSTQDIDRLVSPQGYLAAGTQISHQPLLGPTPPQAAKSSAIPTRTPPPKTRGGGGGSGTAAPQHQQQQSGDSPV